MLLNVAIITNEKLRAGGIVISCKMQTIFREIYLITMGVGVDCSVLDMGRKCEWSMTCEIMIKGRLPPNATRRHHRRSTFCRTVVQTKTPRRRESDVWSSRITPARLGTRRSLHKTEGSCCTPPDSRSLRILRLNLLWWSEERWLQPSRWTFQKWLNLHR